MKGGDLSASGRFRARYVGERKTAKRAIGIKGMFALFYPKSLRLNDSRRDNDKLSAEICGSHDSVSDTLILINPKPNSRRSKG